MTLATASPIARRRASRKETKSLSLDRLGFWIIIRPLVSIHYLGEVCRFSSGRALTVCQEIPGTRIQLNSAFTTVFVEGMMRPNTARAGTMLGIVVADGEILLRG